MRAFEKISRLSQDKIQQIVDNVHPATLAIALMNSGIVVKNKFAEVLSPGEMASLNREIERMSSLEYQDLVTESQIALVEMFLRSMGVESDPPADFAGDGNAGEEGGQEEQA